MTASFPLLKLPLIPLEIIIEQLDFLDLLQLSMKSSKIKRLLELLKLPISMFHVYVTKRSYGIWILRNRNSTYIGACDSVPVDTITELANIQGEPVHIWKRSRDKMRVKSDLSKLATLEAIIKHVLSFSKVSNYALNYDDAKIEIRSLYIWQITTQLYQFNSFLIGGGLVQISPEDLKFLLEEISVADLHMNVDCPGFKFQKPTEDLVPIGKSSSWIDCDKFSLGPKTVTASFSGQKVSVDVLNRLIKNWATGRNKALKKAHFAWEDNDPESLAMAREHETRPPRTILPNRNVEQLKGLCINNSISYELWRHSVFYRVHLSVEDDIGRNGVHLEDQV